MERLVKIMVVYYGRGRAEQVPGLLGDVFEIDKFGQLNTLTDKMESPKVF